MHMLGDPRTMQENPVYEDVVDDVRAFLVGTDRVRGLAGDRGEDGSGSIPGSGSARPWSTTSSFTGGSGSSPSSARPIAFGSSRKSFIGKLTGAEVDQRLGGSIASNVIAYANGAGMLRVHDVAPMRQALTVAEAILDPTAGRDFASHRTNSRISVLTWSGRS